MERIAISKRFDRFSDIERLHEKTNSQVIGSNREIDRCLKEGETQHINRRNRERERERERERDVPMIENENYK